MEWLNNITALASTNPTMYILSMLFMLIILGAASFFIFKIVQVITNKFSSLKIGKAELSSNEKIGDIEVKDITPQADSLNVSNLLNLIIDLPDAAIAYHNKLNEIKRQLISDQFQNFASELRKYRKNIRAEYCKIIDCEVGSDRERLFFYWFSSLFDEVDDEVNSILIRNGLNEKTAEQLEDTLRKLYEETYTIIMDGIENAPPFILKPTELQALVNDRKNDYRKYLEESLNHARKLRIEAESKFQKAKEDYHNARVEIIGRDFPSYLEQIKDDVK